VYWYFASHENNKLASSHRLCGTTKKIWNCCNRVIPYQIT